MKENKGLSLTRTSLYTACAVAMGIGGTRSYAQEAGVGPLEEVTVTGSRIRRTDGMAEPTPVTTVTPEELQMFEPGGTVAEQLDALPQFFATGTAQRGGPTLFGDGGGSYLNMRGLGRNRTLVLLDGSRVVPADKRGNVNVDNLPMALVRSVDVITGGASAAYGADALAGVTNFVLDREFEGLEMSLGTGMNEENSDGKRYNLGIAGGFEMGERWNFIGSLDVIHIDEVYRDARDLDSDWFQRWGQMTNPDPNGPTRITVPWATPTNVSPSGVIHVPGGSALEGLQFTDDGTALRPFELGNLTNAGYTSGGPESTRYSDATSSPISGNGVDNRSGFAALQFQVSDDLSIYGQALIGRTESFNTSQHSTFAMTFPWYETIYRENPFIPASVAATMDAEGLTEFRLYKVGSYRGDLEAGAGEFDHQVFKTESYSVGFNFTLDNGWDLSGSYQSGESRKGGGQYNSLRVDLEALSRDAVIDPATGNIVCNVQLYNPTPAELAAAPEIQGRNAVRGGTDLGTPLMSPIGLDNAVSECVPYNAMGAGNMSQAAWDYIHKSSKTNDSWVKQDFAELLLQGEAFGDGWGYGGLSFATGLTWREQSFHDEYPDVEIDVLGPPINSPALGIRGIASAYAGGTANLHHFSTISLLDGKYDVWEWFGELNMPFWESGDGNRSLGGSLAVRQSDYSSSGKQDSWKYGLEWQAFQDLRFRATRSRDVREASFSERFDVQTGGTSIDDPVTGMMNVNVSFFRGGNPNLNPEEADTTVFGFVYEPSYAEGLRMSLDWYEIDISGAVDSITEQQIIDQCFITGAPDICALINRDSNNIPVGVGAPFLNLSTSFAEGIDFELAYNREINLFDSQSENLSFRVLGGKLLERYDQPPGGEPIDQIGNSGINRPEISANATLTYSVGPWSAIWQQRYISDQRININWVEGVDVDNNTIPSYSFTNLLFRYNRDSTRAGNAWSVGLAINNAFDKNPPTIPGAFNRVGSQTNSGLGYDEFGRRFQLSFDMSF